MRKLFPILLALGVCAILSGCSVKYSASGASIDQEAKTVNVRFFENRAPINNPTLGQRLTQKLRDKIQGQTKLVQVAETEPRADYEFRATITGYTYSNAAVTNVDKSSRSRLTVTVNVIFLKRVGDKKGFTQSFSRSADFDATALASSVENGLLDREIIPNITDDIFNRAFANW
ncbi:lipopolysaccharide assembly protein [Chitinophaga dinghuensis]|uniref:Lipopolysaccharide assembly protein n=1 Tax=Chitinophaga dinghuensis TaxID=1539050 RepID=A0A327VXU3_9BACT|nr:LptE family protein [Chitinophaga dinghuensis]RAJ81799.1 lipopolysaccharide assembly protein [Chitinophaga dinghuensis]